MTNHTSGNDKDRNEWAKGLQNDLTRPKHPPLGNDKEHLIDFKAGGTGQVCTCGEEFATTHLANQHVNWHLNLIKRNDMVAEGSETPPQPLKSAQSEPPINTIEGIEALFKDYKIHHKDIDACFNDAIAVTHLITSIINLVDKEIIGEDEYFEKNLFKREDDDVPKYFRNKLRASQRAKLKGER